MNKMLGNCVNLEEIDLSSFQINGSIQLNNLFDKDISLIDIKMPKINVLYSLNFDNFFDSLINLLNIQFNYDTNILVNSSKYMFNNCTSLVYLNLDKIYFKYIKDNDIFAYMFSNLTSVKSIDLSYFISSSANNSMEGMFSN